MGKERITQKRGKDYKVRGLVMQREGISTLNIYGTPQEPLCKNMYILAIKCVVYKMDGGGEKRNIFYDFCTRRGCETLVPTYHLSCNRGSGYT